jgi:choline kinase
MIGVVLVAGVSRRLFPLTEHRPKCLLEVGDRTIFDHQMDALQSVGIGEVCLVLGYRREQILEHARRHHPELAITTVVNHHFFESNTARSLWMAGEQFLDRDMVLLNGDVLFDPEVLKRVVDSSRAAAMAVEGKLCGEEEVKVVVDRDDRILEIGKELDPEQCRGEFIGVARFAAPFSSRFWQALDTLAHAEEGRDAYYERAIETMLGDHAAHAVDVTGLPCVEIDFPEDYELARTKILPAFDRS